MIRLFLFLILLVGSVWLGLQIYADPGYALFTYRGWSVEMPLWFALFLLLIVFIVTYSSIRLVIRTSRLSKRLHAKKRTRRLLRARKQTNLGLIQLLEGNWRTAEAHLIRAAKVNDTPLINYLAAARAAQEQGEHDRRDDYLRLAHQATPEAKIAIGLTQAELQLHHQQLEQALATLRHLQTIAPHHGYILKLLKNVYCQLGEWQNLRTLLPELHKYKIYQKEEFQQLEKLTFQELLKQYITTQSEEKIRYLWDEMSRVLQRDPYTLTVYCQYLLCHDYADEVEILIREQLKRDWDNELVKLYGQISSTHSESQLLVAETWLKGRERNPELLLCLGRICRRAELWKKACDYLTVSINIKPSTDNHGELAQLLLEMGDVQQALEHYRQGLQYQQEAVMPAISKQIHCESGLALL